MHTLRERYGRRDHGGLPLGNAGPSARVGSVIAAVRPLLDGVRWHERGEVWNGVNVTTPDGRPLIGATAAPGVYVGGHDMWVSLTDR